MAAAAIANKKGNKWQEAFAQIITSVHEEASSAKSKIACLRVTPVDFKKAFDSAFDGKRASVIELDLASDLESAPLQERELHQVIEEMNESCESSKVPHVLAGVGFLMIGVAGFTFKFLAEMVPGHVLDAMVYLACVGFLLLLCSIAGTALCNRRLAIRLQEDISELNKRFADKNVRFDLLPWRYLIQWHQQHVGSRRAVQMPSCGCFNPANPCLYNPAQYVVVIQGTGPGGYLLGDYSGGFHSDAESTDSSNANIESDSESMT